MSLYLGAVLKLADRVTRFVVKRPALKSFMDWHAEMQWRWMGHYKLGLRSDDILSDETEIVQQAIKRLSDQEVFDRTFRIRRAMQLQLSNSSLPESEWVRFDEDRPYLFPHIIDICKENTEKQSLQAHFTKNRASFM